MSEVEKLPEMPATTVADMTAWLKDSRWKTEALLEWAKSAGDGPEKRRFLGVVGALNRDLLVLEQFIIKKA